MKKQQQAAQKEMWLPENHCPPARLVEVVNFGNKPIWKVREVWHEA